MTWMSLEKVWKMTGKQKNCRVRFCDWDHQIKYFTIMGESTDGKRFVGILDSGEKISFPKKSKGWEIYCDGDEIEQAHAV
jgi:hypothetical protein